MSLTEELKGSHGDRIRAAIAEHGLREASTAVEEIFGELSPELTMDSAEEDITRQVQVRQSLNALLETLRLEAVEGPVRQQFESELRALTDAEQDSKELKSAKRSLLFERIVETVELPFPVGTAGGEGESDGQGLDDEAVRQACRRGESTRTSSARRSPSRRARTGAAPTRSARSRREVGVSPRTHGSALFQRGQTQIMTLLTLGTAKEGQRIDDLSLESDRRYMHHYNFPPFSVGETGFMRGPKRRDIGHGALAQRALEPMIPPAEEFPYTIRARLRDAGVERLVVDGLGLRRRPSR